MDENTLERVIRDALSSYYDLEALDRSPLGTLQITQCLRYGTPSSSLVATHVTGVAVRQLLDEAVIQLERDRPDAAELLRQRFRQGLLVNEVSAQRHIGTSTVYEHQQKAIAALTAVVAEMDAQAYTAAVSRRRALIARIPAPTYHTFVGHEPYLGQIGQALRAGLINPGSPLVISGLGGLGKTSLVREALVRWLTNEPSAIEHVLWATVVQSGDPIGGLSDRRERYTLEHVLAQVGEQLDEPVNALPSNEQRLRLLARRLGHESSVVVLDNVETPDEVTLALRIAQALAPVAQLLITSRHRIEQPHVDPLDLQELSEANARELLKLEAERLRIEPLDADTSREVFRQVGGNPLALKLVIAQTRRLPVRKVLQGLRDHAASINALYAHVYHTAWQLLSREAREILLGLILLPPAGATWEGLRLAVESEDAPCDDATLEAAVNELADLSLLQISPALDPVYSLHRLTYRFLERQSGLISDDNRDG
ncbi:MAG: NB-ARC domain-containing protein [Chloroflexota bacterium]|nr:NB-ARC domain-containing protein [Chloroflexota bacterium]